VSQELLAEGIVGGGTGKGKANYRYFPKNENPDNLRLDFNLFKTGRREEECGGFTQAETGAAGEGSRGFLRVGGVNWPSDLGPRSTSGGRIADQ